MFPLQSFMHVDWVGAFTAALVCFSAATVSLNVWILYNCSSHSTLNEQMFFCHAPNINLWVWTHWEASRCWLNICLLIPCMSTHWQLLATRFHFPWWATVCWWIGQLPVPDNWYAYMPKEDQCSPFTRVLIIHASIASLAFHLLRTCMYIHKYPIVCVCMHSSVCSHR